MRRINSNQKLIIPVGILRILNYLWLTNLLTLGTTFILDSNQFKCNLTFFPINNFFIRRSNYDWNYLLLHNLHLYWSYAAINTNKYIYGIYYCVKMIENCYIVQRNTRTWISGVAEILLVCKIELIFVCSIIRSIKNLMKY